MGDASDFWIGSSDLMHATSKRTDRKPWCGVTKRVEGETRPIPTRSDERSTRSPSSCRHESLLDRSDGRRTQRIEEAMLATIVEQNPADML